MSATFSISKNELERIKSLPRISLKVGDEVRFGYYDQETRRFFQTDENGELTGKVAVVNKPGAPVKPTPEEPDATDETAPGEAEVQEEQTKPDKLKKFMPVIAVCGGLIAAACITVAAILPMFNGANNDTPGNVPNLPTDGQPGETVIGEYHITQTTRDILPGQMFTLDDLQEVVIPAADYLTAKSFGNELYAWESSEKLLGYYAGEFIPANTYLEEDEISAVPPYELNPWGVVDSGSTLLLAPVSEEIRGENALNYGNYIDMTVKKIVKTQVAVGTDPNDPAVGTGLETSGITQETTQTKEYPVNDLTICDILNANGESLYNIYCAYIGIPATKRLDYIAEALWDDETLQDKLTPAYVLVRVTNEQASALGNLNGNDTSVTIKFKGSLNAVNNDQYMFAQEAASVRQAISSAIQVNVQRAAEEEAARQQALQEALENGGDSNG